ncbi:MAG TPA: FxDxF family PEP-CTERM protein [Janthinobacterium sp.]|jgi:hypothetical protein|nr:FxDxF family PEP-CTERM protein [Janthinobacterium sp.]
MRIKTTLLAIAAFAALGATAAQASTNLVVNGGFDTVNGVTGQFNNSISVPDWTSNGYNFIFGAGTADTVGANGQYGNLTLWGANNGGANSLASSSNGGNFVGADGAYMVAPIEQTINGLVVGQKYTVSFEWAAAQQYGYTGANSEQWLVNLGSNAATTQSTAVYQNANHSSSSWMQESMTFTATSTSEVLSFIAQGTPNGEPPFSLLDGVSMVAAVPEPSSWAMLFAGLGVIGFMARRRKADIAA